MLEHRQQAPEPVRARKLTPNRRALVPADRCLAVFRQQPLVSLKNPEQIGKLLSTIAGVLRIKPRETDMICAMENSSNLVGQIVCLPGGVRVRIESIEGDPPSALVRRVDGPLAGQIAICNVSKLEPVDSEINKQRSRASE